MTSRFKVHSHTGLAMSYNGIIFRAPPVNSVNDLPPGFELPPLGTTEEIGATLQREFSDWEHTTGQCSVIGDDFSLTLTFDRRNSEPVQTRIGVRIGGYPGPGALALLKQVCDVLKARFLDSQNGEFTDFGSRTLESMDAYSEWFDRARAACESPPATPAPGQNAES
jgi:hypothetical protein